MFNLTMKQGSSSMLNVPAGLRELMTDISREVLRVQPEDLVGFIAKYLASLLVMRENGTMSMRLLKDICDCRGILIDDLLNIGFDYEYVKKATDMIHKEFEQATMNEEGNVVERNILVQLLYLREMSEQEVKVTVDIIRRAYREYQKRKYAFNLLLPPKTDDAWDKAVENTMKLYEKARPSIAELNRAATIIQAAYRGYYVRHDFEAGHESADGVGNLERNLESASIEHIMERGNRCFNIFTLEMEMRMHNFEDVSPIASDCENVSSSLQNMKLEVEMCLSDILRATADCLLYTEHI